MRTSALIGAKTSIFFSRFMVSATDKGYWVSAAILWTGRGGQFFVKQEKSFYIQCIQ